MGRNRKPSTPVRIDDNIILRVKREMPNGATLRDKVKAAIVLGLDSRGKLTQAQFLGKIEPLLKYLEDKERKRRK